MTRYTSTTPDERNKDNDNKVSCNKLGCPKKATEHLDLLFEKYGSTWFFLCKKL